MTTTGSISDAERKEIDLPDSTKMGGMVETVPSSGTNPPSLAFTAEDERRVRLKLDLYLMPLLIIGFFVMQLDRGNIANALTGTLRKDVGLSQSQVNAGTSLLQAGIVIFQLPSNALLQRVGAPIWLTFLLLLFGLVGLCQAWITTPSSFLATRFLMGACESGYIPGSMYLLSLFYREKELASRTAVFYFGNYLSAATGALIAAGILHLGEGSKYAGWQWLFIIEGSLTLFVFFLYLLFLPWSPARTTPIHGLFDFFSNQDRQILQARIALEDASKSEARAPMTPKLFFAALTDYKLWMHCILNILSLSPAGGINVYGPSVIKAFGFSTEHANLLSSVPYFMLIVLAFFVGFMSDLTHRRGPWCLSTYVWALIWAGVQYGLPITAAINTRYAIFVLLSSGGALGQALNDAWLNINATSSTHRSVGLALVVIGSNLGGLAGVNLFQADDAPRYSRAWLGILCLYASSIVVTCLMILAYMWENRRFRLKNPGAKSPGFRI